MLVILQTHVLKIDVRDIANCLDYKQPFVFIGGASLFKHKKVLSTTVWFRQSLALVKLLNDLNTLYLCAGKIMLSFCTSQVKH